MSLRLQSILLVVLGLAGAFWAAISIASESYLVPGLLLVVVGVVAAAWCRARVDAVLLAGAVFGYLVGNRGFAQFMIVPQLPLLVAELVLAASLGVLIFRTAMTKRAPFRADLLNLGVASWVVLGAIRLVADWRPYGFTAARDSAMCYYALFFFVAQAIGEERSAQSWVQRGLLAGLAVLPVFFGVWIVQPEFLMNHLLVHGVPLVFYKADIAATMLAAGVFYFFHLTSRHRLAWLGVIASFVGAVLPLTRAAVVALAVGLGWHVVALRWRLIVTLGVTSVVLAVADIGVAAARNQPLENTRAAEIIQYAGSVLPFTDPRSIQVEDGDVKGNPVDNNAFRLVWWRTIAAETWHEGPVFGLGFGYDLAADFVNEYGLLGDADFSARSPHSIVMSALGRMGLLGGLSLLAVITGMAMGTLRAIGRWRRDAAATEAPALWLMCWVIFVSACFGVVLEGPMGAVVFWTVLGLAQANTSRDADQQKRDDNPLKVEVSEATPHPVAAADS